MFQPTASSSYCTFLEYVVCPFSSCNTTDNSTFSYPDSTTISVDLCSGLPNTTFYLGIHTMGGRFFTSPMTIEICGHESWNVTSAGLTHEIFNHFLRNVGEDAQTYLDVDVSSFW